MSKKAQGMSSRIDTLMEQASEALVRRRYFECEQLCVTALGLAHGAHDYETMARVLKPLQEARRQKRDLAADAGKVFVVEDEMPLPAQIKPGCYLVRPPRVGLDGRLLKEAADRQEVPVIVIVREPTTRTGLWPIVALGPVTVRTRVDPPAEEAAAAAAAKGKGKGSEKKAGAGLKTEAGLPPVSWFLSASEALGDEAIASVDAGRSLTAQVEELYLLLQAHSDHEKLHQRLAEACLAAQKAGGAAAERARAKAALFDEEGGEEDELGDDQGDSEFGEELASDD